MIDGQPHYVKDSNERRHLFWEKSKGCWQVSPVCNDDQGAYIMCTGSGVSVLDGAGDWKWIPPDVRESNPKFELLYEGMNEDMPTSQMEADKTGLRVELLKW